MHNLRDVLIGVERIDIANLHLIKKLVTRESLGKPNTSTIYFSKRRECEDKDLNRVKLYHYE